MLEVMQSPRLLGYGEQPRDDDDEPMGIPAETCSTTVGPDDTFGTVADTVASAATAGSSSGEGGTAWLGSTLHQEGERAAEVAAGAARMQQADEEQRGCS